MLSRALTESIIFIILGIALLLDVHEWNTAFCLYSLALVLVGRFISQSENGEFSKTELKSIPVVYALAALVNAYEAGIRHISSHEQFVIVSDQKVTQTRLLSLVNS